MAKTKKRSKRHKKNRQIRKGVYNAEPDEVRTCVSSEKLDRSCHKSPLQLVDIVTSISTPSPKFGESDLLKLSEIPQSEGFRPRSKSTVPIVHSPLVDKVRCSVEKSVIPENRSTPKLKINDSYLEYKTPVKRVRSNSLIHSLTPTRRQSTIKTKSSPHFDENKINVSFFTPALLHDHFSTPLAKISPIHNSTPKIKQQKKISICNNDNNRARSKSSSSDNSIRSLTSLQSLSPILKNKMEDINKTMHSIQVAEEKIIHDISAVTPTRRSYGKFKKYKWPMSMVHVFTLLQVAVKKGFAAFKRMIYGMQKEQTAMLEQSFKCSCRTEINELKIKITDLQTELIICRNKIQCQEEKLAAIDELRKEIQEMRQKMNGFKPIPGGVCMAPPPPPPPPPPPLPPPLLMMGPTPTSRPLKSAARKTDKSNENQRPQITVNDILNVRLRKTTASTPILRKIPPLNAEEIFKQVKLRPPPRSHSPQILSSSPKSSLTRILKNVDTNVRSIRRMRKSQFISFDDFSRHPSFRLRPCGNDSAPVM